MDLARASGMHAKPVVLLDPDGHYDGAARPGWTALRERGFLPSAALDRLVVTTDVAQALAGVRTPTASPAGR